MQHATSFAASIEKELVNLEFAEKVRYLLGEFSRRVLEKDLITQGGVAVVLEGNSFYHNRDLFSACLKNLRAMTQMMGDRQYKLKKEIVNILIDESFEEELTIPWICLSLFAVSQKNVKSRRSRLLMLRRIS